MLKFKVKSNLNNKIKGEHMFLKNNLFVVFLGLMIVSHHSMHIQAMDPECVTFLDGTSMTKSQLKELIGLNSSASGELQRIVRESDLGRKIVFGNFQRPFNVRVIVHNQPGTGPMEWNVDGSKVGNKLQVNEVNLSVNSNVSIVDKGLFNRSFSIKVFK